jgi:hypothetical protein
MEPSEFFFVILPLGALIVILVSLALYLARKEEIIYYEALKTLSELLLSGTIDKENFTPTLQALRDDKMIDQDAYERLRKIFEVAFKDRVET